MKVFVVGATGLTGRHVVAALVEQGCTVTAHVRPDSPRREHWSQYFAQRGASVDFTPWELPSMEERMAMLSPDIAFALLGSTRRRTRRGDGRYETVDFGLTALLIDALVTLPRPVRFVYLSSLGADNAMPSRYLAIRKKTEAYLAASGLPFLVARPSFITGIRDEHRPMEKLGAQLVDSLLKGASLVGAHETADRFRSIDAGDLAWAMTAVALYWQRDGQVLDTAELRPWADRKVRPLQ